MYRTLTHKAIGLRQGQVVRIVDGPDDIEIKGCNDLAEAVIRDALQYVPRNGGLRLRVVPDTVAGQSGAHGHASSRNRQHEALRHPVLSE